MNIKVKWRKSMNRKYWKGLNDTSEKSYFRTKWSVSTTSATLHFPLDGDGTYSFTIDW